MPKIPALDGFAQATGLQPMASHIPATSSLDSVYSQYPRLHELGDVNIVDSRSRGMQDDRQLEYYPADERDNPKPGKPTIELFNPALKGEAYNNAIAADMLHGMPSVDPEWRRMRAGVMAARSPQAKAMDNRAYAEDQRNGETRSPDEWESTNRADAYLRGYLFPDAADEWRKSGVYNDQQKTVLERMRQYLTSNSPMLSPIASHGKK